MRTAQVVIGANWGDEGKGLMVDFLASRAERPVVVRFNGGAQAGHTVVTPDGQRHVFSHFGSGTLAGAPTYLSRFFVCHPTLFVKELRELNVRPRVWAHPDCLVTTPWDMLVNQLVEAARGHATHGSVGVGFNETIERHNKLPLTVGDLLGNKRNLEDWVYGMTRGWIPRRLVSLGFGHLTAEAEKTIYSHALWSDWINDLMEFTGLVSALETPPARDIIFEGAQGLQLDQTFGHFPYVTRSNTGLKNAATLAEEWGIGHLDVHYVTRTYFTRHGAGPLPGEDERLSYEDNTNRTGEFQGPLRFAPMNFDVMAAAIVHDFLDGPSVPHATAHLAITHVDQCAAQTVPNWIKVSYYSTGPTRENVREGTP